MKTITNVIIIHAVFLAIFAGAAIAFAQEDETATLSPSKGEMLENHQENSAERQAQMKEARAEHERIVAERQAEFKQKQEGRQEAFANRQDEMEVKKEERQAQMGERKAQLQEQVQERITNLAANMSTRMETAIERIQKITDRLDTRIQKIAEAGVDTTAAEEALASAQLSIDAAFTGISNIDTDVSTAVGAEDVRTAWGSVKTSYTEIRDNLRTAHSELQACVTALKEAVTEAGLERGVSEAVRADEANKTEPEQDTDETTN